MAKDKERLELTFNMETEGDLWEFLNSFNSKKATTVKKIIRDKMIESKAAGAVDEKVLEEKVQAILQSMQGKEDPAGAVKEAPMKEEPAVQKEEEPTFDISRSPLFQAKEI